MYRQVIENYSPVCVQEAADRALMLELIRADGHRILTRENRAAHMTASSMIFNRTRDKVLLIYHNIYKSFAWTGGHSDGEHNPLKTAAVEAQEETGIKTLRLIMPDTGIVRELDGAADYEALLYSENDASGCETAVRAAAALDILTVDGHVKRGQYVSAHLHLNVSYLFEADETEKVRCKPDENSAVRWVQCRHIAKIVNEPLMIPVYEKLLRRSRLIG